VAHAGEGEGERVELGLGPRGKEGKEERGGKEMGREKSRPKGFGCFPSFPFPFLYSNIQTKLFEFKCKLNSNL
jgi:hypothetical protein